MKLYARDIDDHNFEFCSNCTCIVIMIMFSVFALGFNLIVVTFTVIQYYDELVLYTNAINV